MKALHPARLSFGAFTLAIAVAQLPGAKIWVSPTGSDGNPGTSAEPLANPATALRRARELRRTGAPAAAEGIHIILKGGVYALNETIRLRPEDSGTPTSPTVIEAAAGEYPVLSGAVRVQGWRKATEPIPGLSAAAQGNVWIAETPEFCGRKVESRMLWIGERKAVRARTPDEGKMERLKSWDRAAQRAGIPCALVADLGSPAGLEMIVQQQWEIAVLRVASISSDSEISRLSFHQPESRLEFEHPWPQPILPPEGAGAFFLANHIRFLDTPGEWFQDLAGGRIVYWPRPGEDLSKNPVYLPALETLLEVGGTLDRPVSYVEVRGVGFQHTTWLRPSTRGHVPLQAGMYLLDGYKLTPKGTPDWQGLDNQAWVGRPPAAVAVSGADHVAFEACRFEHLAMNGLDHAWATHDNRVEGCLFRDIGGNALLVGAFSDEKTEAHLPYNPADTREVCARERIANNLIEDCANEDWGALGIGVGFAREIAIEHNEIRNVSYTGISVGWGWTRSSNVSRDHRVIRNLIHHVATRMCDTAGIYTLSAQPGTEIAENVVHSITMTPYVDRPEHWFYLYLDEGSSFIRIHDNWCPEERFLKNANGPGNVWENNGPMVSSEIKALAGPQPRFRYLQTW